MTHAFRCDLCGNFVDGYERSRFEVRLRRRNRTFVVDAGVRVREKKKGEERPADTDVCRPCRIELLEKLKDAPAP